MQQATPDLLDLAGAAWGGEGHGAPLDYTPADMTHDLFLADAAPQHHPYMSAIQTITQKHTAEIKSVLPRALTQNHGARNRLRDFLASYNEQLMTYFVDKDKISPTITAAEHIFRKYGKSTQVQGNQKELILDLKINDALQEIEKELIWQPSTPSLRPQGPDQTTLPVGGELDKLIFKLRKIMDLYKGYAVEMLKTEEILKTRCEYLEKLSERVSLLQSLPETDSLGELITINQRYLEEMFNKTNIKQAYDDMISTYKKMLICREIVTASVPSVSVHGTPLCSVCLTDGVTHACVPCGHTFCLKCTSHRTPFACYVCRKPITQLMKLFFS
jgi:hypothetical protein